MFAKLYETSEGQILVKRGTNPDGDPAVSIICEMDDQVLCEASFVFEDDDKADKCFEGVDEPKALDMARLIKQPAKNGSSNDHH